MDWKDWDRLIALFCGGVSAMAAIYMLVNAVAWLASHIREFNALKDREARRWAKRMRKRADRGGEWIDPSDAIS